MTDDVISEALAMGRPVPPWRPVPPKINRRTICGEANLAASFARDRFCRASLQHADRALQAGLEHADAPIVEAARDTMATLARWLGYHVAQLDTSVTEVEVAFIVDFWDAISAGYWVPDEDERTLGGTDLVLALDAALALASNPRDRLALAAFRHYQSAISLRITRNDNA